MGRIGRVVTTGLVAASTFVVAPMSDVEAAVTDDLYTASLEDAVRDLPVRGETPLGFEPDQFPHWIDADSDDEDTRAEVLIAESSIPATVNAGTVVSGSWYSYLDEMTWTEPSDVEIAHLIPLQEAWESGAAQWTPDARRQFANDLDDPRSLVAVTDDLILSRGSRDLGEWLPPGEPGFEEKAECRYLAEWVAVKHRWSLSIDEDELRSMTSLIEGAGCFATITVTRARPELSTAVQPGFPLRVNVPEASGGRTVVGQLTVARATQRGFVTAYGCDDGIPRDAQGDVAKSDLNFDGTVQPVASNRLIVTADIRGDVCFYVSSPVELIVDISAHTDGIENFANQRTDTRTTPTPIVAAEGVLTVNVPEAAGAKTVVGQLTAARVNERGFVTAYGCDDGPPVDADGGYTKSDLNFNGAVQPVASNRLVVTADADGDICFYTSRAAALVVDVSGATSTVIEPLFNQRTDTRPTRQGAGAELRVTVSEAVGGKTVAGQLTAALATERGFVTAYGCDDGIPRDEQGEIAKSDLNFNGVVQPVASNRLIVTADDDGDICFYTSSPASLIIDINGVSLDGITSIPNQRTDTRNP